MNSSQIRQRLASTNIGGLRLRAKKLAEGWTNGVHRAQRKGSGIEFAGHRAYFPGDDLRHLDRHAFLRHGRLLLREFHTDTERPVHILVDLTRSMNYRGSSSRSADTAIETKANCALLLAAAIAFIAKNAGDALGLSWIGNDTIGTFPPRGGKDAFEQVLHQLENYDSERATKVYLGPESWNKLLSNLGACLPRGTILFVLSDFLDFTPQLNGSLRALCTRERTVRAAQILSPDEVDFPFEGALRLQGLEGDFQVETNAESVANAYRDALKTLTQSLAQEVGSHGGSLIRSVTSAAPDEELRRLIIGSSDHRK